MFLITSRHFYKMSDITIVRLSSAISHQSFKDYVERINILSKLLKVKSEIDEYKQYPINIEHICDGGNKCTLIHLDELKSYVTTASFDNYWELYVNYISIHHFICYKPKSKPKPKPPTIPNSNQAREA